MTAVEMALLFMQAMLAFGNLCIMLFALRSFLKKPHEAMENRVFTLETKVAEIENSLHKGNDRFREQDTMNEVFLECMLAFIDFEIAYCLHTGYEHSEDLNRAKKTLQEYLAKK